MRLSSLDPISLKTVKTLADAPYVVEGMGPNALVIFFENEANKAAYLDFPLDSEDGTTSQNLSGKDIHRSAGRSHSWQNKLSNRIDQ